MRTLASLRTFRDDAASDALPSDLVARAEEAVGVCDSEAKESTTAPDVRVTEPWILKEGSAAVDDRTPD